MQAFHSSDVIGLFGIVERSPEITLVKESNILKEKRIRHSRRWRKVWQLLPAPEGSPALTKKEDFQRISARDSKPKENDQKTRMARERE